MKDLAWFSLIEAAELVATREISPVELTRHLLDRIDALDGRYHSYRTVLADSALEQARLAERAIAAGDYRGPLHGIPIAIKDLVFTQGIYTSCGSAMMQGWLPEYDGTVWRRLDDAGAILLGKLHMTEFALRWHHPAWPMPVNPWGDNLWPGVSSSGSGVATAVGLCYGSLGTDTGGSIRFPSACNGVVGLKPTYGRVSRYGVFPLAASLDNVGPITRRVADAAAMLAVLAGHDSYDPTSSRQPVPDYLGSLDGPIDGLRVGVDEQFIRTGADPEVSEAVLGAIAHLSTLGAKPVQIDVPVLEPTVLADTWSTLCAADAADAHTEMWPARADEYGPFRAWLEFSDTKRAVDYAEAHRTRLEYAGRIAGLFEQVDLLACPAMPSPPLPIGEDGLPLTASSYQRPRYTYPFNFSNSPTLTLPCGFTSDNLPIAMQLVGPHFSEDVLLRVGHAYEQSTQWHLRTPPVEAG